MPRAEQYPGFNTTQIKTLLEHTRLQELRINCLYQWANELVAKLNADAGVTDTNYEEPLEGGLLHEEL